MKGRTVFPAHAKRHKQNVTRIYRKAFERDTHSIIVHVAHAHGLGWRMRGGCETMASSCEGQRKDQPGSLLFQEAATFPKHRRCTNCNIA